MTSAHQSRLYKRCSHLPGDPVQHQSQSHTIPNEAGYRAPRLLEIWIMTWCSLQLCTPDGQCKVCVGRSKLNLCLDQARSNPCVSDARTPEARERKSRKSRIRGSNIRSHNTRAFLVRKLIPRHRSGEIMSNRSNRFRYQSAA